MLKWAFTNHLSVVVFGPDKRLTGSVVCKFFHQLIGCRVREEWGSKRIISSPECATNCRQNYIFNVASNHITPYLYSLPSKAESHPSVSKILYHDREGTSTALERKGKQPEVESWMSLVQVCPPSTCLVVVRNR